MKFIDVTSGMRQPVSNEEYGLINKIKASDNSMLKQDLDERERQLAFDLCKRSLLTRTKIDGKICYVTDDLNSLWRI